MKIYRLLISLVFSTCLVLGSSISVRADSNVIRASAIAMNGTPKYEAGFSHFEYVNPTAPKGGDVRLSSIGSYDSFNAFISKGVTASGLGMIYETLTTGSSDEAFTEYGLIADKIEYPEDRSWVVYHLNPKARFHDGEAINVDDVIFTFNILMEKGAPFYKSYYGDIVEVKDLGSRWVKFKFREGMTNRELVLITGQLPVLPKHYWEGRDFSKSTLEPPLGSGAYRIKDFKAGKYITYERVKNYWAADHPVNKGSNNFDTVRYDYYRDSTVALEAFKAGEYDFREENNSKMWASMYSGKTFENKLTIRAEIPHELPRGMQGFAFNLRRSMFKDRRVREAIGYAFDFEWSNKNLFYGQYRRTDSYFENSELASSGLPSPEELAILEPLRKNLPPEVFNKEFNPPLTDSSGNIRKQLRAASKLLTAAGWKIKEGKRVNSSGEELKFEILLISPAFERIVLPFKKNLERMGISASVRVVDTSQYVNRIRSHDFDMFVMVIGQSLSPGNEQDNYWSCTAAETSGTRNFMGICNPAIDKLIRLVIEAPDRKSLINRTRALDRALLWGHYVVPHWHINYYRLAYWNKFSRPEKTPKYSLGFFTWWIDSEKQNILLEKKPNLK
ncbi:MAG: ABC transporter substrate-binding protein [SAR324 cluster bacterium]|nr:ABC transporter substrate-binding protein [SAR324 cluster bacterium]MBL7036175.1 ABC transporter substrate-binding protein [SAR324 cluster bacterium]